MTTKDNKLSCQSSTSGENSNLSQLLLLQQLNNVNNNMYSTSPRANQGSSLQSNNQGGSGNNTNQQNASVLQKLASINAASASASSQHGRWTKEEHQKFLEGLNKYGKNWKKVEEHIGTRTGAQIRSHAQKFFNRLEKEFGKTNILKDMNANSSSCQQNQQQQSQGQQGNAGVSLQMQQLAQNSQSQGIDLASALPAELAHQLLKLERQSDFYEDITPMISQMNSSPESVDIHHNPLHAISQNNSVSLNIKPNETSAEGAPKKKDWSKILSAQEKLKQAGINNSNAIGGVSNQFTLSKKEKKQMSKNEKKMTKQLTQLLDQQCQHLTQNIPYENQGNKEIDFDTLNQVGIDQEVSPSDFISQNLLNSIFEPADIETHLIQFYIAQMNLEQLINQKKQYDLNEVSPYMQNQMKKKKLSVDSISTCSGNNNNNIMNNIASNLDNISCSQLSHSTAISTTSPSSSAFAAPRFNQQIKIAQPQPNNSAAVQQNRNQQLQQKQMKNQNMKQSNEDINQISEYQQSLLLFNLLSSIQGNNQNQQQSTPKNMKEMASPKFNTSNNISNGQNSQIQPDDLESELLKHLLTNLQQKQSNQFSEQYPNQDILSQKINNNSSNINNFKTPSVPHNFNSKNEQSSLNFTSTEEEEDDENYNLNILQKQLMQVFAQQPQLQMQNPVLTNLKNARY